jgi:hypothetical protein
VEVKSSHRRDARLLSGKPERLERHLARHPEDADRLEQLTELPSELAALLGTATESDYGFNDRMRSRTLVDPDTREALGTLGSLLGLGFATLRHLATPDDIVTHDLEQPS